MSAATPVPSHHPLTLAWRDYQQTEAFANSKRWAMRISPMVQSGEPDAEAIRDQDLMPREQREQHVQGSLWAAFMAGFTAAHPEPEFILTREGKLGVGYSNKTEEGGFTVLKWAPDAMLQKLTDLGSALRDAHATASAAAITAEQGLLLTVARIMRARIQADVTKAGHLAYREDRDDLWSLNEALKPFGPSDAEPVNEANRPKTT